MAAVLSLLSLATILASTLGGQVAEVMSLLAAAMFLLLCLLASLRGGLRERLLLVAAIALTALLIGTPEGRASLREATDLAAFFGAFIAALTVMRDVAARSRSILAVGRYLIEQPPGRRFFATAFGGHFLAVFLNFGSVSLMSPLIQESVKDANGVTDKALERRQLSALVRGFAWVLLWAPTMLTQAIMLAIFTANCSGAGISRMLIR